MSSNNPATMQESNTLQQIIGRGLNVVGVVFIAIMFALGTAVYTDISAVPRTIGGLVASVVMVLLGQVLAGRANAGRRSEWFGTTLMSVGYALAYFFIYATYYVKGLNVFETPYLCWVLGPALGAIGTLHGTKNRNMRWFSAFFTLLVTGHALQQVLMSTVTFPLYGFEVHVAAVGALASVFWCAGLSALNKRLELRYSNATNRQDTANWLMHRIGHEVYFVGAAVSAMALPYFQDSFALAPLCWSVLAPLMLGLTYVISRRAQLDTVSGYIKHGVVALIWVAASVVLIANGQSSGLENILAVPIAGVIMSLAYRTQKTGWADELRLGGYSVFMYGAVVVSLLVPLMQFGLIGAMPYWLIGAVVLAGLGMLLRDGNVHDAGWVSGLAGLALFFYQFNTWSASLVIPVIGLSYALSVAYSFVVRKSGRKQDTFFSYGREFAVSVDAAEKLERLWSWVGAVTVLTASLVLVDHQNTVFYWAVEGAVLIGLGFVIMRLGYRLQGLAAFGVAIGKLLFWDLTAGQFTYQPDVAFTMMNAAKFGVIGISTLLSSFLYFREEARIEALLANAGGTTGGDDNGTTAPATPTEPTPDAGQGGDNGGTN